MHPSCVIVPTERARVKHWEAFIVVCDYHAALRGKNVSACIPMSFHLELCSTFLLQCEHWVRCTFIGDFGHHIVLLSVLLFGLVSTETLCFLSSDEREHLRFRKLGLLTNLIEGAPTLVLQVMFLYKYGWYSLITASSEYGAQGVVEIDSVETDIGGGLVILPDELKDRSVNLAERCALQLQGDVSSFFINGQGGLPVWSRENYLPETIHWERSEE